MSFRINTNVQAMNALRNLSQVGEMAGRSITRLSSGLRINNAGDDPAGLIASENFRAQIAGLDQAIRNNQDAINFAKTAEGALDELTRLIRDARALAVASANTGSLTEAQRQANQNQLASIAQSIDRIASTTAFGSKKLLDGSAGIRGDISSAVNVASLYISGRFNDTAITTNSAITVTVTTTAQQASVLSVTFTNGTDKVGAGSFTLNGKTFTTSSATTVSELVAAINSSTGQTGVTAQHAAGGRITLKTVKYGLGQRIDLSDASGILLGSAGVTSATGVNAVASVAIDLDGAGSGGATTVTFTGGRYGYDGLTLTDNNGNAIRLTETGNITTAAFLAGQVIAGSSRFQVGANANETAQLSIGNFAASQLGVGVVNGLSMSNLDLSSADSSTDAIKVIDAALEQVSRSRGDIGSFVRNSLESNVRSLGISRENLAATESAIRDTDFAAEIAQLTKLQIIQQSGISVLAQANSAPQMILALLR